MVAKLQTRVETLTAELKKATDAIGQHRAEADRLTAVAQNIQGAILLAQELLNEAAADAQAAQTPPATDTQTPPKPRKERNP